ncbi:M20/M25/M40 family metallo-hydrolase [Gottfriedia acidiceleris]|uniref:M20/M25/M40 family metallo-hydrolase n=1 Tax=Gottfriedia acidiceleris TaxID=371036 RepID=UPI002FFF6F35
MHPELSNKEFKTTETINHWLEKAKIKRLPLSIKTGTAAEIRGLEGPTVAVRVDIDPLPIQEESDLPFRSVIDGVAHMCGHDVHTSIVLVVVFVLQELKQLNRVLGSYHLLFRAFSLKMF